MRYIRFSLAALSLTILGAISAEVRGDVLEKGTKGPDSLNHSTVILLSVSDSTDVDSSQTEKLPEMGSDEGYTPVEVAPEMIREQVPEYPRLAKQAGQEGTVWVKSLVDKDGRVRDVLVAKSSGVPLLDQSAVKAAYGCLFKPAIQRGQPIAIWVTYKVGFKIGGGSSKASNNHAISTAELLPDSTEVEAMPRLLYFDPVEYSRLSRKHKDEGSAWLRVLVSSEGNVLDVKLAQSSGHKRLDESAMQSARKNKFTPAVRDGKPVDCWVKYKVEFLSTTTDPPHISETHPL